MARLQILELPEGSSDDRPPFVLVVDQYEPIEAAPLRFLRHEDIAEQIGARAVLVFEETIDIPANDTTGYLSGGSVSNEVTVKLGDQDVRAAIAADMQKMHDAHGDGQKARDKGAELRGANEWIERLAAERDEARSWARHGYEIGQKHCGWSDHGVAPDWLTEGWPTSFDSCEHLKQAAALDEAITRARNLHAPVNYRGTTICRECSAYAGQSTDNAPVAYDQCATLRALSNDPVAIQTPDGPRPGKDVGRNRCCGAAFETLGEQHDDACPTQDA